MDAWIYTDNTGNVEVELKDEFLNAIVYHATFNGLPGNTAGSFGSAFFGAQLNELSGAGNTYMSAVYDVVRLDAGNTVGASLVPEPSSFVLAGLGVIGLVTYARRYKSRK